MVIFYYCLKNEKTFFLPLNKAVILKLHCKHLFGLFVLQITFMSKRTKFRIASFYCCLMKMVSGNSVVSLPHQLYTSDYFCYFRGHFYIRLLRWSLHCKCKIQGWSRVAVPYWDTTPPLLLILAANPSVGLLSTVITHPLLWHTSHCNSWLITDAHTRTHTLTSKMYRECLFKLRIDADWEEVNMDVVMVNMADLHSPLTSWQALWCRISTLLQILVIYLGIYLLRETSQSLENSDESTFHLTRQKPVADTSSR